MKKLTLLAMSLVMTLFVKAQSGTDITGQFENTDFETGSTTGWTISGPSNRQNLGVASTAASNSYQGTYFMESWRPSNQSLDNFDWSQTQEVANGFYVVKALAHSVMQGKDVAPEGTYLYAEKEQTLVTTTSASEFVVYTGVADGTLTIGYRGDGCNANWVACDDFHVTQYLGETIGEAAAAYAAELLEELVENKIQQSLVEAMEASIAAIGATTTWEEAKAVFSTFDAQVEEAKASAKAYIALLAKIEQAYVWGEEGLSEGADEFEAAIVAAEEIYENAPLNVEEVYAAVETLDYAIFDFFMLNADGELEYDMTDLHVTNASVRANAEGWVFNPAGTKAAHRANIAEFFNVDYDISQTIEGLPNGMYAVYVTGFYRASSNDGNAGFNAHENRTEVITAELYANKASSKLACLYEYSVEEINAAAPKDKTIGGYNNFANSMEEASVCFDKEFYTENKVTVIVTDGKLTFGLRNKNHASNSWTAFRDFKLGYLGNFPAVVLTNTLDEAQVWLDERVDVLPLSATVELSEAISEAEPYSYLDSGYENEEVLEVLEKFEAIFAGVKNVEVLVEQLKGMLASIENELIDLDYPDVEALQAAYEVAAPYVEDAAEFELEEGLTTEQTIQSVIATLQEAINAYYMSQVVTRETPADYTFLLPNPNFEQKGDWNWSMSSNDGEDLWVGPINGSNTIRPSEDGGEPRYGVNLWGRTISSIDVHQDLVNIPNGLYKVSAELITQKDCATDQHVYAVGLEAVTSAALQTEGWDTYEWEQLQTEDFAVVVDGKLTVGIASTGSTDSKGWFQATNFKLYYYGEASAEDLKGVWDASLERANEYAEILLAGDSKVIKEAIAAATPLAESGKYVEAYQTLNPVVVASDSIYDITMQFMEGNIVDVEDLIANVDEESYPYSSQVLAAAKRFVDDAISAEDATYTILAQMDEKLGGYVDYVTYLIEAEDILATIKGVDAAHKTFVKDEIITPQVADLTSKLRSAAACEDLLGKLRSAVKALQGYTNLKYNVGDATSLIVNPTIDDEAATGWTIVKGTGNGPTNAGQHYDGTDTNRYLDSWNPEGLNFTAYQEIVGLPDGTYQLKVAARSDGDNAYIFAAPNKLEADTAAWTATTQWDMIKNNGDKHGEIWYADSLAWVAADGVGEFPYFNANNAEGRGWSYNTITVEVTGHYLAIGVTANHLLTGKEAFTASWIGADDWTLQLVSKSETQSEYSPFTGIENVEIAAPVQTGIYDLFGRRIETPTSTGIYIVNGVKTVIKK